MSGGGGGDSGKKRGWEGGKGGREKAFRVPLRNGGLSEGERECACVVVTGLGFRGIRLCSIHRAMEGFNNNQNNTTVALMEQADDATEGDDLIGWTHHRPIG